MEKKRERGANYTSEEKSLLADLIMQYKHIIEDKRCNGMFLKRKKQAWQAITVKYNAHCTTGRRNTEKLKALYDNMKQKTRKTFGESNKEEHLNRQPLVQMQDSEEDLALKALKDVKEEDVQEIQMSKTSSGPYEPKPTDCDAKMLALLQGQVQPLPNPFDSAAVYFKATDNSNPTEMWNMDNLPSAETLPSPRQVDKVTYAGADQCSPRKMLKTKNDVTRKAPTPMDLKRSSSAEALKRLYFKKKCQNADLERKKLVQEIILTKKKLTLEIELLKQKFESEQVTIAYNPY